MLKFVALAAFVAVASAGVINAPVYSHGYAAPAHSAATSHSSITQHTVSHAAAPVAHYAHAAPVAHYAHAAPVAHYAQAAPVAHYAQAAPVAHYAHAASVGHYAHAAPVAHYSHAAPVAHYAAPVHKVIAAPVHKVVVAEHEAPAHYDFEYSVHDPHTGDVKEQKESRKDDAVHGFYSLIEADGSKRTVEYTADDHNGFNAVVHREPSKHPVAQKVIAPVAVKAIHAAPVAYHQAAPALAYNSYSAPAQVYHH